MKKVILNVVFSIIFSFFIFILIDNFYIKTSSKTIIDNIEQANQIEIPKNLDNLDIKQVESINQKIKEQKQKIAKNDENTTTLENIKTNDEREINKVFANSIKEKLVDEDVKILKETDKIEKLGEITIPTLNLNLSIFKGKPAKKGLDTMLVGAITNKENQKMGQGNYILASHIVDNKNLLFSSISDLKNGQAIYLRNNQYTYQYVVYNQFIVNKNETWILKDIEDYSILTLYTCKEDGTLRTSKRTVVRAVLVNIY